MLASASAAESARRDDVLAASFDQEDLRFMDRSEISDLNRELEYELGGSLSDDESSYDFDMMDSDTEPISRSQTPSKNLQIPVDLLSEKKAKKRKRRTESKVDTKSGDESAYSSGFSSDGGDTKQRHRSRRPSPLRQTISSPRDSDEIVTPPDLQAAMKTHPIRVTAQRSNWHRPRQRPDDQDSETMITVTNTMIGIHQKAEDVHEDQDLSSAAVSVAGSQMSDGFMTDDLEDLARQLVAEDEDGWEAFENHG
jgi:hypothetical protein